MNDSIERIVKAAEMHETKLPIALKILLTCDVTKVKVK